MELYTAEQTNLEKLIKAWIDMPDAEIESTFGEKGTVREDAFLRVARRLRSKGFREISQQERLSVLFKDKTRYTISGIGSIKRYCEAEHIQGLPFIAIIKNSDSSIVTAGGKILTQVDIQEYKLRIKSRREVELPNDNPTVKEHLDKWRSIEKAFRYIRRWTFQGNGVKFDLSMVRSTEKRESGEFRWVKSYKERELSTPVYEIEVELEHEPFPKQEDAPKAMKALLQACGEVLRGIQNNTVLIRESVKEKVLGGYGELVGTSDFRGANTGTLMLENMTQFRHPNIPNIRDGYNVTDKADGLRVMGFVDRHGELFLIDRGMNVYRPGLGKQELAGSLVDGEWITHDHEGKYINRVLLFDIYNIPGGKEISQLPFKGAEEEDECRYEHLQDWSEKWLGNGGPHKFISNTPFIISVKQFFFAKAGDNSIFSASDSMLKIKHDYHTDGLIFTKNESPLPRKANTLFRQQMKWKPPKDNTVDFLLTFEKEPVNQKQDYIVSGIHPDTKENIQYKIGRLFVSSDGDTAYDNPRATILNEEPLPGTRVYDDEQKKPKLKAVLFNPSTYPDTMASIAYMPVYYDNETGDSYVRTEMTMEPVRDRSIVEMAYDASRAPGWRWYARNVRADKTSVFQRGTLRKTLNFEKVAEDTWKSIHEPVTHFMISTGEEVPSPEEIRVSEAESKNMIKYYESKTNYKDDKKARGMINFHNLIIKEQMLYAPFFRSGHSRPMTLIDLAVGQGGDMNRWMKGNVDFILGVDKASGGILDPRNGAYRRLMDNQVKYGTTNFPPMLFINADSSRRLTTGEAGTNQQEVDMLRSVFGQMTPEGPIPKYVSNKVAGKLSRGVDGMTCMFALHYFFESKEMLDGLIENIGENLKIGGYFFGANFDGESVFQMLRGIKQGENRSGTDDSSVLWKITKEYDMDTLPEDDSCFGIPINVDFISIGKPHQEFLVNFKYFTQRLREIGLEILPTTEARMFGIPDGTQLFSKTFDIPDVRKKFHMSDTLKQFSFLNRWYIFKRTSQGTGKPSNMIRASVGEVLPPLPEAVPGVQTFGDRVSAAASASAIPIQETAASKAIITGATDTEEETLRLKNVYPQDQVYQFFEGSAVEKGRPEEIVEPYAKRWVAPSGQFPIPDPESPSVIYPSIYNYSVAMYYKHALKQTGASGVDPAELAVSLFSSEGSIHNEFKQKVQALKIAGTFDEAKHQELIAEEFAKVKEKLGEVATNKRKNVFQVDEAQWTAVKDKLLKQAVRYRVDRDEKLRAILEMVRRRRKILLYFTRGASELGGAISLKEGNKLVGENKYARYLMEAFGGFNF